MKRRPFRIRLLYLFVGTFMLGLILAISRTLSPPEVESTLVAVLLVATLTLFLLDKRSAAFWVGAVTLAATGFWVLQVMGEYR